MLRIAVLLTAILFFATIAFAETPHGVMENGNILVPLPAIAAWLNASMQYDSATRQIVISLCDQRAALTLNAPEATLNGKAMPLPTPVIQRDGVTFVPLRFFALAFKVNTNWNAAAQNVTLSVPYSDALLTLPVDRPTAAPPAAKVPAVAKAPALTIHQAVLRNDAALVQQLLLAHPECVNAVDAKGVTPLLLASEHGYTKIVAALLAKWANPNIADHIGRTPLHMAAFSGQIDLIKRLLAAGAWLNARDRTNDMPLHYVAVTTHVEAAKLLLAQKTWVNARDKDGDTPLRCAVKAKQTAMAAFLRSHGGRE